MSDNSTKNKSDGKYTQRLWKIKTEYRRKYDTQNGKILKSWKIVKITKTSYLNFVILYSKHYIEHRTNNICSGSFEALTEKCYIRLIMYKIWCSSWIVWLTYYIENTWICFNVLIPSYWTSNMCVYLIGELMIFPPWIIRRTYEYWWLSMYCVIYLRQGLMLCRS